MKTFDVKTCQRKLAEHYQKTAKVPTTVWTSKFQVDLEQIYTRLSWVKQEQTLTGVSQNELSHYTEIFTEKKNGGAKRILVQGETGIGKTTFIKKLLVDWSHLEEAKMDKEQKDTLRKYDLVVSINLKEVSKCRTFKEVLSQSRVFPDDETSSIDDLLSYIGENQDKVLLVFDGYDEYRTGSEAEEKYGSRSNSPIFEVFHGNVLRDCTVLVTTRSSRADELQECADIHAEITGFNWHDRKAFMLKFLGSQTEVDGLLELLRKRNLNDLARVPLLNLFFCLLWKEEKENLKEGFKSKTELFQTIMKHILQHSHKRHAPSNASQLKEADYNEILTEIGKVALQGLLRGDLLFKVGQLSEKVRGEKSVIVGLVQVSESGPSVEPKEMVSFIHKSIQEYLAAWFVTYRCVPEGNLGGIEKHACTLEECTAFENVFQFVSGLSSQGAEKVFEHFSSVRTGDLSVTINVPDADNQTDLPLYDLTEKHWWFSDLAFSCFREVNARTELLNRFLDCFGEIVPVPNHVPRSQFIPHIKDLSTLAHSRTFAFRFHFKDSMPHKSLEQFIKCFHIPRTTQSTEVHRVGDFLAKFLIVSEDEGIWEVEHNAVDEINMATIWRGDCVFHFILRLSIDQFQVYITDLFLSCNDHARLFTETTEISLPSVDANMCSEAESCLKFLRSLRCSPRLLHLSDETMKSLGGAIRYCKQLRFIEIWKGKGSVCDLLEQVPNPSQCSLKLGIVDVRSRNRECVCLTSAGAVKLASLLPRFNNISHLHLSFVYPKVDALITRITHKSLKELRLTGMMLTPAAVAALGLSLPKMPSLEILDLKAAWNQGRLQAVDMEALFGRFNVILPLYRFSLSGVSGYLAPLTKSFRFFPNLQQLYLEKLNMDEQNVCDLLEGLRFIPNVRLVSVQGNNVGLAHLSTANANTVTSFTLENLKELTLNGISLNPAAAAALGRSLPEMSSLEKFQLTGLDGNILQAEVMELLFGRFNKAMPLQRLSFGGFIGKGVFALLFSLHFFSKLEHLHLLEIIKDDQDLSGLLESLRFLPNLQTLCVENKRLAPADSSVAEVNTVPSVSHRNCRKLTLKGISLTPTIAAILGQSLPKMSSLRELELTGLDGSVVPAEQMERLFDGFTEKLPLYTLHFSGFNVRGCLAPLTRSFSSFPDLMHLSLGNLNMDEHDLRGLLESFQFIPNLKQLDLSGNQLGPAVTSIVRHVINLPKLYSLYLYRTGSEEDLNSVRQELRDCLVQVITAFSPFIP